MRAIALFAAIVTLSCLTARALAEPPDARAILEQANAAMRAVQTVRYEASGEPGGFLTSRLPKMRGLMTLCASSGDEAPKLRLDAEFSKPGQSVVYKMQVANDGKHVTLADYAQKIYVRQAVPAGTALLGNTIPVLIREFAIEEPLEREAKATTLEYTGTEMIGDVECDVIHAVFGGQDGAVRWYFAKTDHLPRRVQRIMDSPDGEATLTITISKLEVSPKVTDDIFRFEMPEGFRDATQSTGQSDPGILAIGSEAPDWTLPGADGKEVTLKSLRGRIVLLDFWATWCRPCVMAMPGLQKLHEKYKNKPVTIFGVNCWERNPKSDPAGFMKERKFTYPQLFKADAVARAYKVTGVPTFYLIGPDGKILLGSAGVGPDTEQQVEALIEQTLKTMSAKPDQKP